MGGALAPSASPGVDSAVGSHPGRRLMNASGTGIAQAADVVDAVLVGAGPNGLTAAAVLARAGLSVHVIEAAEVIGGGTRSEELTVAGVVHDVCSAVHPFGVASPVFSELGLDRHGLTWRHAPVDVAHPLDGGRAGILLRSVADTAAGLGPDGARWASRWPTAPWS